MSLRKPDETNPYNFYLRMKRYIEFLHDSGLSNPQIAKIVGLSRQSVWRHRRGKQGLSWKRRQRYRKLEQPLYKPVKRALEAAVRRAWLIPSLTIWANTRWKECIPDIKGWVLLKGPRREHLGDTRLVAEVKAAPIRSRHVDQLAGYQQHFSAPYALLVSSEPIAPDVSMLPLPEGMALAHFNKKGGRLDWSEGNPFWGAALRLRRGAE